MPTWLESTVVRLTHQLKRADERHVSTAQATAEIRLEVERLVEENTQLRQEHFETARQAMDSMAKVTDV